MATTIQTVIVKFQDAVKVLGLKLVVEQPRYAETNVVVDIEDFKKVFSSSFMKQLVSEGSDQFILAYTGE